MKKTFTAAYNFNESVVLKTDPNTIRHISGMMLRPIPRTKMVYVTYGLTKGEEESWFPEDEIAPAVTNNFKVKGFIK